MRLSSTSAGPSSLSGAGRSSGGAVSQLLKPTAHLQLPSTLLSLARSIYATTDYAITDENDTLAETVANPVLLPSLRGKQRDWAQMLRSLGQLYVQGIDIDWEGFAQNDLYHTDLTGADHHIYKDGLNLALSNYLNGEGFDVDLQDWFDFAVTATILEPNFIEKGL